MTVDWTECYSLVAAAVAMRAAKPEDERRLECARVDTLHFVRCANRRRNQAAEEVGHLLARHDQRVAQVELDACACGPVVARDKFQRERIGQPERKGLFVPTSLDATDTAGDAAYAEGHGGIRIARGAGSVVGPSGKSTFPVRARRVRWVLPVMDL